MKSTIWQKVLSLVLVIMMALVWLPLVPAPALASVAYSESGLQAATNEPSDVGAGDNISIGSGSGTTLPLASDWDNPYADIDNTDWFYDAVRYMTENGLMNGTSETMFSPYASISRAMFASALYCLEGKPEINRNNPFPDVPSDAWYTDAVLWIEYNGIMMGYGDGIFDPNAPMTCQNAMTILYRYAQSNWMDVKADAELSDYVDSDSVVFYAADAMKWAVALGIIQGRPAMTLKPLEEYTRAELAATIRRLVEVRDDHTSGKKTIIFHTESEDGTLVRLTRHNNTNK